MWPGKHQQKKKEEQEQPLFEEVQRKWTSRDAQSKGSIEKAQIMKENKALLAKQELEKGQEKEQRIERETLRLTEEKLQEKVNRCTKKRMQNKESD